MATHLDLEEQEQLDQLKAFWNAVRQPDHLGADRRRSAAFAAWNGWNWWQRDQAVKAGAMYDELDTRRAGRRRRARRPRLRRPEGALSAHRLRAAGRPAGGQAAGDKGQADAARATLAWVADNAVEDEYRTIARLRLAGLLLDEKKYDEALKQLDGADGAKEFEALAADRRGDVLLAQGKKRRGARPPTQKAWTAMDAKVDYRRAGRGQAHRARRRAGGRAPPAAPASAK